MTKEIEEQEELKEYEIWSEGYAATGERCPAHLYGKSKGKNFIEACQNFTYPKDIVRGFDGLIIVNKGSKLNLDTNADGTLRKSRTGNPSIWACALFDNESDARKSFG